MLEQQAINAYDLKMLNSIIKAPRLCDEYQKALRRKFEKNKLKKLEMECYVYLKDQMSKFTDEAKFLDHFVTQIDRIHQANSVQPEVEKESAPLEDSPVKKNKSNQKSTTLKDAS